MNVAFAIGELEAHPDNPHNRQAGTTDTTTDGNPHARLTRRQRVTYGQSARSYHPHDPGVART